jgi:hypothetical protein
MAAEFSFSSQYHALHEVYPLPFLVQISLVAHPAKATHVKTLSIRPPKYLLMAPLREDTFFVSTNVSVNPGRFRCYLQPGPLIPVLDRWILI